jgi:hypothetical protein
MHRQHYLPLPQARSPQGSKRLLRETGNPDLEERRDEVKEELVFFITRTAMQVLGLYMTRGMMLDYLLTSIAQVLLDTNVAGTDLPLISQSLEASTGEPTDQTGLTPGDLGEEVPDDTLPPVLPTLKKICGPILPKSSAAGKKIRPLHISK